MKNAKYVRCVFNVWYTCFPQGAKLNKHYRSCSSKKQKILFPVTEMLASKRVFDFTRCQLQKAYKLFTYAAGIYL